MTAIAREIMSAPLNPRWVLWRLLAGTDAPTYEFLAFITRQRNGYCRARGIRVDLQINDQDDFTAWMIDGHLDTLAQAEIESRLDRSILTSTDATSRVGVSAPIRRAVEGKAASRGASDIALPPSSAGQLVDESSATHSEMPSGAHTGSVVRVDAFNPTAADANGSVARGNPGGSDVTDDAIQVGKSGTGEGVDNAVLPDDPVPAQPASSDIDLTIPAALDRSDPNWIEEIRQRHV